MPVSALDLLVLVFHSNKNPQVVFMGKFPIAHLRKTGLERAKRGIPPLSGRRAIPVHKKNCASTSSKVATTPS